VSTATRREVLQLARISAECGCQKCKTVEEVCEETRYLMIIADQAQTDAEEAIRTLFAAVQDACDAHAESDE
jgi:hypothetical protein